MASGFAATTSSTWDENCESPSLNMDSATISPPAPSTADLMFLARPVP